MENNSEISELNNDGAGKCPFNHGQGRSAGKGTTNYPQFMNGKHGLAEYIKNEIKYPEDAKNQGITGIAIVEYTINKNGEVVGVKKAKNSVDNDLLVDELIRVVEKSNPWLPGTVEDKPEKMTLTVSYEFVLTGK